MRWKILTVALVVLAAASALAVGYMSAGNERNGDGDVVTGTGTIKFLSFEGGFYGIVGDDGEHYDSLNLDEEFRVSGLRVYFEAKMLLDVGTFHMWGKPVSILEIQRLE